jgi:DNA-binding MarR family transcriptional regulator
MPHNPQDPNGYTLVPNWVFRRYEEFNITVEETQLLIGICRQRQGRQDATLAEITGIAPRTIKRLLNGLEQRGIVTWNGSVYDVPVEAPR